MDSSQPTADTPGRQTESHGKRAQKAIFLNFFNILSGFSGRVVEPFEMHTSGEIMTRSYDVSAELTMCS